jgi:NTP pyrophosphatase (non-canonical NTP hydrolase)
MGVFGLDDSARGLDDSARRLAEECQELLDAARQNQRPIQLNRPNDPTQHTPPAKQALPSAPSLSPVRHSR